MSSLSFLANENFEKIIKEILNKDNLIVKKIETGWTNYVYHAILNKHKSYIFRFPRNDFFAKTLEKENVFCKFIKNKTSYKTPNIQLFYNQGRPFTMHKYMKGKTLTECYQLLNEKEKRKLGYDISRFIFQIQKATKDGPELIKLSKFLDGLSKVDTQYYDLKKHNIIKNMEKKKTTLAHADFNPGNILLNSKNKMFAVLDFAFVSYTSDLVDISRVIGRLPKSYTEVLLNEYEKYFDIKINRQKIIEIIDVWNYVEKKYINYIKKCHPDIVLP